MKLFNVAGYLAPLSLLLLAACVSKGTRSDRAVKRADSTFHRGDLQKARNYYSSAIQLDHLNGKAYLGLARTDLRLGHPERAEPALTRALDTLHDWPSVSECYVDLANLYLAQHWENRPYLDAAGGMASRLLARDPKSFDGHRIWAEVSALRAAIELSPSQASAWRRKAFEQFAIADQIRSNDPAVLLPWALALRANSNLESAQALYLRALKHEPGNRWILAGLYSLALEQGNAADAATYVQQALRSTGNEEKALIQMARDAIAAGHNDDAHTLLNSLFDGSTDPELLADLFAKAGYPEEGVHVLQKAIGRYPSKAAHYSEETTQKLALLRKDSLAAAAAKECLARFPADVSCRAVEIFEDYRSTARSSDIEALERLAAANPASTIMRLYLGHMFQQGGKLNKARLQFNFGLNADHNNADLRLALAELELVSNAPEAARADAQYLLNKDPRNRPALDILNRTASDYQP